MRSKLQLAKSQKATKGRQLLYLCTAPTHLLHDDEEAG